MHFLKNHKRATLVAGAIVLTLLALVVVTVPGSQPGTSDSGLGGLFGQVNRTAPDVLAGASLTDTQIGAYQEKLRKSPKSADYANLGLAYLQKAREVGDPTYYTKAEGVFKKALELDPQNADAMGGMGSLSLSRHQFSQALDWGQKAKQLRPYTPYNYGVIVDALVELGRYDEAAQVAQQLVDLRPDISSYSRISYLRELNGLYDGAVEAMKQAIAARGPAPENLAYVTYQLGQLYYTHNNLPMAEATFQQALNIFPNYFYAQAGMARIKAARGDLDGAIKLYKDVTKRMPLAEFVIELGDIYGAAGRSDEANRQYDLVRGIQNIYRENGVDTDLEMALFNADHNYNLPDTLNQAKAAYQRRPSVKGADVLAWAFFKTGDYNSAAQYSQQALRLGTQDALAFFHAGMIDAKLGKTGEARAQLEKALNLNPNFSFLYANEARQTLAQLGGVASK